MNHKKVVIVVPCHRARLAADERISLSHLHTYCTDVDKCLIVPSTLGITLPGVAIQKFPPAYFRDIDSYSRLLLSREFYERFSDYEYMLIYQLDALVFSNGLAEWCARGFDYIGAPLFNVKGDAGSGFSGACNGGLSLRRVSSFLKVLNSTRYVDRKVVFLMDVFHKPFVDVRPLPWLQRWKKRLQVAREVRQGVQKYTAEYSLNEDHFWSGRASYFYPEFRVASPGVALAFAFEAAPAHCFEQNGRRLPFGAHAWAKYDRTFWEPYLIPQTSATQVDP